MLSTHGAAEGLREYRRPTLVRDSLLLFLLDHWEALKAELGAFPGEEQLLQTLLTRRGEGSIVTASRASPPFPRTTAWATGGGLVFVGDNASFRIDLVDLEGSHRMRILCLGLERPLLPRGGGHGQGP